MGLDWLVGPKPAGSASEIERGWEILRRAVSGDAAAVETWKALPKVCSWEVVGAPRVGLDEEATLWAARRIAGKKDDEPIGLDSLDDDQRAELEQARGHWVVALAPACDGIPVYSNAFMNPDLEATSFRGSFLHDAEEILGEDLLAAAYERKIGDDFQRYTLELERRTAEWAAGRGLEEVAARREAPDEDEESPESIVHIAASAARWCRYWSDRGFWLDVWF